MFYYCSWLLMFQCLRTYTLVIPLLTALCMYEHDDIDLINSHVIAYLQINPIN